ncbi:MAG: DUF6352 family protein, partial [Candidatus Competibacterales bacterium]|nr:DUF6352 family protein [Candidatus Competibacterales bacterium]
QQLLDDPARPVSNTELDALADPDARENYRHALAFRDLLLDHDSLEQAYLAAVSGRAPAPPPVLLDWLVQLILCRILDPDPYRLRASELLFRRQRVSLDGGVVVADAEYLQRRQKPRAQTVLESLIRQAGGVAADGEDTPTVAMLNDDTRDHYRQHSEAHDLALSLAADEPGLAALARVLEGWLRHFLGLATRITPLPEIRDPHWRWHIGLDADSNRLLNRLYREGTLDEDDHYRLLALLRLDFDDPQPVRPELRGYPVYLGLAMNPDRELRLKPQNLLLNLPLSEPV